MVLKQELVLVLAMV
jgi:hypothetical protein